MSTHINASKEETGKSAKKAASPVLVALAAVCLILWTVILTFCNWRFTNSIVVAVPFGLSTSAALLGWTVKTPAYKKTVSLTSIALLLFSAGYWMARQFFFPFLP